MQPKISVIIPAYNEEKLIGQCIDAVSKQTLPRENYEILVINNNSTDKTAEIARKHGAKVHNYTEKQGFLPAKQFGTSLAQADIVAYTDADSLPDKTWLETIYTLLQRNPQLVCVGGTILATSNVTVNVMLILYDVLAQINQLFGISLIWSPNMALRKSAFLKVNGFNEKLVRCDDWDLVMRLQKTFGVRSILYTTKLKVRTSPRRQQHIMEFISYFYYGVINYFIILIFRQSKAIGALKPIQ